MNTKHADWLIVLLLVRIVLSPAPSEKASSDQSSPNAREDPSHQTKKKKQTRGLFSKSQISWPVAFQGTTNKVSSSSTYQCAKLHSSPQLVILDDVLIPESSSGNMN